MALTSHTVTGTTRWDAEATASPESIPTDKGLVGVEVDNRNNSVPVYLKLYDKATTPTVGSDVPEVVMKCPAGARRKQVCGTPAVGHGFSYAIHFVCVTEPGKTGTTSPTNAVPITLITKT